MKTSGTSRDNVVVIQVSKELQTYVHRVCRRQWSQLDEFEQYGLRLAFHLEVPVEDAFDFIGHFTLEQLRDGTGT
jgi:hypothetical protein